MSDWRDKIAEEAANAQVAGSGNFFTDGEYPSLIIEALKLQNGTKGLCFIAEFMAEASSDLPETGRDGQPVRAIQPGGRCSVVYNHSKHKSAAGNTKALALAVAGMTEAQLIAEQEAENARARAAGEAAKNVFALWIKMATNDSERDGAVNPCRGKRVAATTVRQATEKQKGSNAPRSEWNVYPRFRPVTGQTRETILAARAKLDSTSPVAPRMVEIPPPVPPPMMVTSPAATAPFVPSPAGSVTNTPPPGPVPSTTVPIGGGLLGSLGIM